jgi:hypothetical protein
MYKSSIPFIERVCLSNIRTYAFLVPSIRGTVPDKLPGIRLRKYDWVGFIVQIGRHSRRFALVTPSARYERKHSSEPRKGMYLAAKDLISDTS